MKRVNKPVMKLSAGMMLLITLFLILIPHAWAYQEGSVEFSDNLTVENIRYVFYDTGKYRYNFTVTGPTGIVSVRVADTSYEPWTREGAEQKLDERMAFWKEHDYTLYPQSLPISQGQSGNSISEDQFGNNFYILMAGLDEDGNLAGYAMIRLDIPESGSPEPAWHEAGSGLWVSDEALKLENVSPVFQEGVPEWYQGQSAVGFITITGTVTGMKNDSEFAAGSIPGWCVGDPATAELAESMGEDMAASFKANQYTLTNRALPASFSTGAPVFERGQTNYYILCFVDADYNLVGYAMTEFQVPEGGNSGETYDSVLVLPEELKTIESQAFDGVAAEAVRIPSGVTEIADDAFVNIDIIGTVGTAAEQYASDNGFTFVPVS